ncbi:MAG: TatD family hydrolase [Microbacter sp.]
MNQHLIQIIQWFPGDPPIEPLKSPNAWFSVGIHPCQMNDALQTSLKTIEANALLHQAAAIGETGLDKTCNTDVERQTKIFKQLALLAERTQKPLIIHCVKAWQEIIAIHRELHPSTAWIIHGFRGKPELAESLLKEGFFLSFGARFNEATIQRTAIERLCVETDESTLSLETIYQTIASIKNIPVSLLLQKANAPFQFLRPALSDAFIDAHTHLLSK